MPSVGIYSYNKQDTKRINGLGLKIKMKCWVLITTKTFKSQRTNNTSACGTGNIVIPIEIPECNGGSEQRNLMDLRVEGDSSAPDVGRNDRLGLYRAE